MRRGSPDIVAFLGGDCRQSSMGTDAQVDTKDMALMFRSHLECLETAGQW
jgi:hypothetical protein